jgi:hypothetical protein
MRLQPIHLGIINTSLTHAAELRVARWYIFIPKISNFGIAGGPWN